MTTRRPLITKTVTDEEARRHTERLLAPLMHRVVRRTPKAEKPERPEPKQAEEKPQKEPPKDDLRVFLHGILDHPNDTVTERKDRFGWSGYRANRIKALSVKGGFAVELPINLGRKTRGRILLMQLTAKGYERLGEEPPKSDGFSCGPVHWWWQQALARYIDSLPGTEAAIEHTLNGKRIDVAALRETGVHAFEVELSPDNAVRNAKADLEAGATHVTVACKDTRVLKAIGERIGQHVDAVTLARITLTTLADLPVAEFLFGGKKGSQPDMFRPDERGTTAKSRALVLPDLRKRT